MKHVTRYFLAVLAGIALMLTGCGKDPLVADLEAFDALGRSVFEDTSIREINAKVMRATSNAERAAAFDELVQLVEGKTKAMASFSAKTPEVGAIATSFNQGLGQMLSGAKRAKAAFQTENQAELTAANAEIAAGQKAVMASGQAFSKLAKEKGVTLAKLKPAS